MSASAAKRIASLREQLDHHNHLYYVEAKPTISDQEFDGLLRELIDLEALHQELQTSDSPSVRVGGAPIGAFRSVTHAARMMSIDNTYDEPDLRAFDARVKKGLGDQQPRYVLEPKVDGVAVSLRYEGGRLVLAATRGDGFRGDDITANVRTIRSVPLKLRESHSAPEILEVRGEIFMNNDTFQVINAKRVEAGEETFANPRNFTAGTLKQLDPKITASRKLRFVAHGLGQVEPLLWETYWDALQHLKRFGLPLGECVQRCEGIDDAVAAIKAFAQPRGTLAYQTDGMVMKVDSFAQRRTLGETSKAPRWVIAFKYPAEQVQTTLNAVDWQVGKAGTLTPVARLTPVFVAGTTVSNATLHNIEQIQRLDLHLGDTVVIEKAGEIIPQVVQVVLEKRPETSKRVVAPKHCPSCDASVEKEADTPYTRCVNPACPAQLRERVLWFVARGQMYVEGLGESIVDQLVEAEKLKTIDDIYRLTHDDIAELKIEVALGNKVAEKIMNGVTAAGSVQSFLKRQDELLSVGSKAKDAITERQLAALRATPSFANSPVKTLTQASIAAITAKTNVGNATASKILQKIEASKSLGLARVIAGLGIRNVGNSTARDIALKAQTWSKLSTMSLQQIQGALAGGANAGAKFEVQAMSLAHLIAQEPISDLFSAPSSPSDVAQIIRRLNKKLDKNLKLSGEVVERLADTFANATSLREASADDLAASLSSPRIAAEHLYQFIHSERGGKLLGNLQLLGVSLDETVMPVVESKWAGKIIVITGSFDRPREQIRQRLEALGARVSGSVSKNTDYVLTGEDAGSKLLQAKALQIKLLSQSDLAEIFSE